MHFSYQVTLPDGATVGVSDDAAGDERLEELLQTSGDCHVAVYDRDAVFGRGYDGATPLFTTTLKELLAEEAH